MFLAEMLKSAYLLSICSKYQVGPALEVEEPVVHRLFGGSFKGMYRWKSWSGWKTPGWDASADAWWQPALTVWRSWVWFSYPQVEMCLLCSFEWLLFTDFCILDFYVINFYYIEWFYVQVYCKCFVMVVSTNPMIWQISSLNSHKYKISTLYLSRTTSQAGMIQSPAYTV